MTNEEKSHGRNKQPRISCWKNAIDKPSQDEGPQKSARAPEGKRQETRGVQGPHGTKRGREPAEFDGNEIKKERKGKGINPFLPKGKTNKRRRISSPAIEKNSTFPGSGILLQKNWETKAKK